MANAGPGKATASAVLTIRLDRVVANYRQLCARANASCAAVVKADAYGLGAVAVARALIEAGCSDFFVAMLDEALALRAALGPIPRIFVLNGLPQGAETIAADAGLTPVLNTLEQCRAWARLPRRPAVLQVDTGMSRLGLTVPEQEQLLAGPVLGDLNLVLLMSHLANADEPDHQGNAAQLAAFRAARDRFPTLAASLANSAGIFLSPDYHFDLVRPGAALYGIEAGPRVAGIVPVIELHAAITQVRAITAGTSVGYGYAFTAATDMTIATIPVGYADGWLRSLSNAGAVWLGEARLPIIGRVSMDSFIVDLGQSNARPGDMVELLGPRQSADDVARMAGTIGYEVLTSLGHRYHRRYMANLEHPS